MEGLSWRPGPGSLATRFEWLRSAEPAGRGAERATAGKQEYSGRYGRFRK